MSKEQKSEATTTTKTASTADSGQKETPVTANAQKSETTTTTTKTASTQDAGQKEMQAIADKETAQGFVGVETDKTDNFNYTLKGVTSGKPTPETDAVSAAAAREAVRVTAPVVNADAEKGKE